MSEKQLQHQVVMWFSQTYPQFRGLLFEVNNDTYNVRHAMARKSIGMVAGVSDLILISPKNGKVCGIELKAPGARHKKAHIEQQLEWGEVIKSVGGSYIMSSDIDEIKRYIEDKL